MADNVAITAGSGTTVRTVDIGAAVETQVLRIDVAGGSVGSYDAEVLGLGKSLPLIVASAGLTTATTAYTSGDQLGTELSFANAVRSGRGGVIQSAVIADKAKILGAVDLYLFSAATTPAADNAANSWSDADMLNCLGIVHFTDVITSANNGIIQATNLPFVIKPGSGTTIYADLVTRTGHTFFGAVGDIQVTLGILQD